MSLRIDRRPLKGPELCHAYLNRFDEVARFYRTGSPNRLESYRQVAEAVRDQDTPERWDGLEALADAFPGAAAERLRHVIAGRGLFVSTGQQAGLFVSPLYVIYKALTAARLADDLERHLGVPVMPLFSVASEDHDWAEVNHTQIVDLENRLLRVQVTAEELEDASAPSPPVEQIELGEDVEDALRRLREATPETEFKDDILAPLSAAYRPGRPFATAFQEALGQLLRRWGIAVVRTADPYVKRSTRRLLWSEWERRVESERQLMERTADLSSAGFEPQVPVSADVSNLFMLGKLGRDRIIAAGGGKARLRRSDEVIEAAEFRRILEQSPQRVSPGALFRPVTEAAAFPVVAHVVGPSEIAYLAQSHALFELHGVPAPVVVPRASFQLIEAKIEKVLEKYELEAEQLGGETSGTIKRLLDDQVPEELRASLSELRKVVARALEEVETAAVEFDPGSRSAVGSGKKAIFGAIGELESKLQGRVREKHAVMEQQLEKVAVNLYPNGRPQERVLNPYPYLIRYGESLLDQLYDRAAIALA